MDNATTCVLIRTVRVADSDLYMYYKRCTQPVAHAVSGVAASDVYVSDNVVVSVYTQRSMEAVLHLSDPRYDAAAPRIYADACA